MRLYSGLVERCFTACAQDFTSKALTTNEVGRSRCLWIWISEFAFGVVKGRAGVEVGAALGWEEGEGWRCEVQVGIL